MHATICDLILDLVQNSMEANASEIELSIRETETQIEFTVQDNGKGMNSETLAKATDPFYSDGKKHAHRRVGLGLPFLIQTAEAANGQVGIESEGGRGTTVRFQADANHVDLPPFGDFSASATMMMSQMSQGELIIRHETDGRHYTLSRTELIDTLGDLNETQNLTLMKTYIRSQEEDLRKAG